MSPSFPRHKMTRKRKKKATQRIYTQLNELNIYSFTLLKTASVRSGKKIQLMTTIPMNKILGRTILACKLFFGIFKEKPPFQNKNERYEQINCIIWTSPAYRSEIFLRRLLFKFPPEIRIALFSKGCPKAPYTVPRNRGSAYFCGVCWRRRWCRH